MTARERVRPLALAAPTSPEPRSNVVQLRPGFVLPVPAPEVIRTASGTDLAIRSGRGTAKKAKNPKSAIENIEEKDPLGAVLYRRSETGPADLSCTAANAKLSKAEFAAMVKRLRAMELIERFPLDYSSWRGMFGRRGEGCEIAPEFRVFRSFLKHMGVPRPAESWTLDRINPYRKEYGPGLCRWAPKEVQANNRTDTILLTGADGRTLPLTKWAELTKQDPQALRKRRKRHPEWSDAEVIGGGVIIEAEQVPAPAAPAPAPTGAGQGYRDRWPPDTTPERWEGPYEAFRAKHGHRFGRHLRRSVFFSWVAGGWLRTSVASLERRFPDFRAGEWDRDPAFLADPHRERFERLVEPVNAAFFAMDDSGRGTLELLREADPSPESQNATLRVRFPELDDDGY